MARIRRIALAATALLFGVTGCASAAARHEGNRAARAAPRAGFPTLPPFAIRTTYPCGAKRAGALTAYNGDGSVRWNVTWPAGNGSNVAPVADHGVVFSGHAGSVSATQAADGSTAWDVRLGSDVYNLWLTDGVLVANVDQVSNRAKIVGLDPASGTARWTYRVPGGGFLGDAVLSGDGGLAFRVADTGMLTMLDVSNGHVRWMRHVGEGRSPDGLPSAASGLVVYTDAEGHMYALDARTGAQLWQVATGITGAAADSGRVVVSGDVGVATPDAVADSTPVVAHSLRDGREVWHRDLSDISAVYPDEAGFVLVDYRADTVTLVRPTTGAQVWQARLHRIDNLEQAPLTLRQDGTIAVLETDAVAFVDRDTGAVRQVPFPMGVGRAAGAGGELAVTNDQHVALLTADGAMWTAALPDFGQTDPAVLDDGGVAVQSEDPECGSF